MSRDLPKLGFGLGVSGNWSEGFEAARAFLAEDPPGVDFIELYPGSSRLSDTARQEVRGWQREGVPITLHAATLDLWSAEHPDHGGLALTREIERVTQPVWTTQDLMLTRSRGARAGVLLTAILTDEAIEATAQRYAECTAGLRTVLLLENAPYQLLVGELGLGTFFRRLVKRTGCGLTLDLGHVIASAMLGSSPVAEVLEDYPFESVIEIHIAGGRIDGTPPRYIDDHDAELPEQSLQMLGELLPRCPELRAVTYEVQAPALATLRPRVQRVRATLAELGFVQ